MSADSLLKIIAKVFSLVPGVKKEGAGIFYYPEKGYGQISDELAEEVRRLGGSITLSTLVKEIDLSQDGKVILRSCPVIVPENGKPFQADESNITEIESDFVFATIPVTILSSLLKPKLPDEVAAARDRLTYRGMVLHYLILDSDQFTPYDAHYFPGENVIFSRLSEPKNYYASTEPQGRTGLCFEIPCEVGDEIWNASAEELTERVKADMVKVHLPVNVPVREAFSRRIPQVYPIYDMNFDQYFAKVDKHLDGLSRVVPLGRQALFAHDNTHHTMEMAYRASDCLGSDLSWNEKKWQEHRVEFEEHVVVD